MTDDTKGKPGDEPSASEQPADEQATERATPSEGAKATEGASEPAADAAREAAAETAGPSTSAQATSAPPPSRLRRILSRALGLVAALLGTWSPPPWLRWVGSLLGRGLGALWRSPVGGASRAVGRRWKPMVGLAILAGLAVAGVTAWQDWQRNQPGPPWITLSVDEPGPTALDGRRRYQPLVFRLSGSGAPLELVGQSLGPEARAHIAMDPAVAGDWAWSDDHTLRFEPSEDWPVDEEIAVTFQPLAFSDTVRVEQLRYTFRTARFSATLQNPSFYEDPTAPKTKKLVATVRFTHLVDKSSFEKHLALVQITPRPGAIPDIEKPVGFSVRYSEHGDEAYIHSDVIPIPDDDETLRLSLLSGVQAEAGGRPTEGEQSRGVTVPGIYSYFKLQSANAQWVNDENDQARLVLLTTFTDGVTEEDLEKHIELTVLPVDRPAQEGNKKRKHHSWGNAAEVSPADLQAGTAIARPNADPPATRYMRRASFPLDVAPKRSLFVRLKKGLTSEGGYILPKDAEWVVRVPDLSIRLDIAHEGGILALSGERSLAVVSRGLSDLQVELGRVIPSEVNHLVTQTRGDLHHLEFPEHGYGDYYEGEGYEGEGYEGEGYEGEGYEGEEGEEDEGYREPPFTPSMNRRIVPFGEQNITDPLSFHRKLALENDAAPQYTSLDFSESLRVRGSLRGGLFFVRLTGTAPDGRSVTQKRFVLVTDLGVLSKQNADRSWDVFVQSLSTGRPVEGATVEVVATNGRTLASDTTGDDGHAHFKLIAGTGAHQPVAFVVEQGGDLSFVPFDRQERRLNLSRFDVGGVRAHSADDEMTAFVFSDRGIYRPGETLQFAAIARSRQLDRDVSGLLVRARIHDAKGRSLLEEVKKLEPGGLFTFDVGTSLGSPTGTYTASVTLVKRRKNGTLTDDRSLGSATARVEEFVPDTMKIKARLSQARRDGWVKPEGLSGTVVLENLFGAPASDRTAKGRLLISPVSPWFPGFPGYTFQTVADRQVRHSVNLPLDEETTNADGEVTWPLDLSSARSGLWRVTLDVEGYEPGGGRSVSASTSTLVSPLDVVLGTKADGDLGWLKRDAERNVTVIAVDPSLKQVKKDGLGLVVEAEKYVSVLVERRDGTLAYQSERRLVEVKRSALTVPAGGEKLRLDTSEPGTFLVSIREGDETLVSFSYTVAGRANLSRQMEKNAELKLKLAKDDYAPGETIEMSIVAPYAGAGLITIEGDEVHAWRWFEAKTTSVVEQIEVPEGVSGNAYVHVTLLRSADSREVFTRPLSTAVAPFSLSRRAQTVELQIDRPTRVRPGDELEIKVSADQPTRAVLYGVDEGILQVARYGTPMPTAHFFKKRALQVTTWQLLDLLLPEASVSREVSASGGSDDEADEALAGNLNPFQRKVRAPVAFFAGVLDLSTTPRTHRFKVPDDWTGSLKIMAVASSSRGIGSADATVKVRGDLVLTPSAPLFATPGDTFEVTVGVSNQIEGSGEKPTEIVVEAKPSNHLKVLGASSAKVAVAERREGKVTFLVQTQDVLGGAELAFTARASGLPSGLSAEDGRGTVTLSVRPASPYLTSLFTGQVTSGETRIDLDRELYPHLATRDIQLGSVPIAVARGLYRYVDTFPYGCTEQLVSKSMAGMMLHDVEGIGIVKSAAQRSFASVSQALRFRQVDSGAFGMWAANATQRPHHTIYAAHFLLEAKERGWDIDGAVLEKALGYVKTWVKQEAKTLEDARLQAYGLYVLARSGKASSKDLAKDLDALHKHVQAAWPKTPTSDLYSVWSSGAYSLLKMDDAARARLGRPTFGYGDRASWYFSDTLSRDMQLLYVVARHFPSELPDLTSASSLERLLEPLRRGGYNTLSSAYSILALRAYLDAVGDPGASRTAKVRVPVGAIAVGGMVVGGQPAVRLREILQDKPEKKARALAIGDGMFPTMAYSTEARALELESHTETPLFYQVTHAGFDKTPPDKAIKDKLEIVREIRKDGEVVDKVEVGDEVVIHLKVRVVGRGGWTPDVAIVDLLPAGFSIDMETARSPLPTQGSPSLNPDFVDVREDRMLIFTSLDSTVRSYAYKAKATAPGKMVVPPPQAMSMYELALRGRGVAARLEVTGK